MAKRKRLTPANPAHLGVDLSAAGQRAPDTKSMPRPLSPAPIAQVAGEASATAALSELAGMVETARSEGRMIEQVPLAEINIHHLVRDRMVQDQDEMAALVDSIRARGQQTPIEVTRLPEPVNGMRYGLISGWRRVSALNRLYSKEKDEKFATVRALVIAPGSAQDAYVAMVEENEIRVNLSHYERARIALRAVVEGVYPTRRTALQGLYGTTTRSKRSKIGSFIPVVDALDPVVKFPAAISEKLGLSLSRALGDDPDLGKQLRVLYRKQDPQTAEAEAALLTGALRDRSAPASVPPAPSAAPHPAGDPVPRPRVRTVAPAQSERHSHLVTAGLRAAFTTDPPRIELSGADVDAALFDALQSWLKSR